MGLTVPEHPDIWIQDGCWLLDWSPDGQSLLVNCDTTQIGTLANPTNPNDLHEIGILVSVDQGILDSVDWQRLAP